MTLASGIDLRGKSRNRRADVVLGEDWTAADGVVDSELKAGRERRGFISLNRSPLARKIITFNLMAMIVLVAGVLYLNPFRDSLVLQALKCCGTIIVFGDAVALVFERHAH